jgi:hypothetical protein
MKRRVRFYRAPILTFAATWIVLGCSTNAPPYSAPVATPETVFVVPGPVNDASLYDGPTDFGALFAEYLAGALQARGISALAVPRGGTYPQSARFVVTGHLIDVDPGSWNLRFWIGLGAGRALIQARTTLRDATQQSLAYDHTDRSRSLTWQSEENILRRALSKLARAAASDLVVHLRPAS